MNEFKIKREERIIPELHVTSRLEGKIGIIVIPGFGTKTTEEFYAEVTHLLAGGATSFIIDLRKNPGGYVRTCVEIASAWLDGNKLITALRGRGGEEQYASIPVGVTLVGKPTVVLVSESTASASEIFSGALQDWKAATIVGTTTFGKGIAQSDIRYHDGSSLHLTTARWYTPSGREIHGKGIQPDIEVFRQVLGPGEEKTPRDSQMERALEYLVTGK